MKCDQKTRLLMSCYMDGETTPQETSRAKAHLEECPECRKQMEKWAGQRTMFEWAYSATQADETRIDWSAELVGKRRRMSLVARLHGLRARGLNSNHQSSDQSPRSWRSLPAILGSRLALAGMVMVLAISAGFVIHHLATMPHFLAVGVSMVADSQPRQASMEGDIQLTIGPHSKVTRVDDESIRLEEGWVSASVRHGTKFKVVSPRLEVLDQGTKFEVGTGRKTDYVIVDEGSVEVICGADKQQLTAGEVMIAKDSGKPLVASIPSSGPGDDAVEPLGQKRGGVFAPCDSVDLDFDEGVKRLASMFPDVRQNSFSGGYGSGDEGASQYRFGYGALGGIRAGLRAHFYDIAQAIAGDSTGPDEWEMSVAIMQTSSILLTPELPADIYILQLVCKDRALLWRLTGSMGSKTDYPFSVEKMDSDYGQWSVVAAGGTVYTESNITKYRNYLLLADWPGKLKPAFKLIVGTDPSDAAALHAQMASRLQKTQDFDPTQGSFKQLYLDRERRHQLMIIWNNEAGKQLCRLSDLARQRKGGNVTLGALETSMPLEEPTAGAGTYLLRFVLPVGKTPHLEITTSGGNIVAAWGSSSRVLRNSKLDSEGQNGCGAGIRLESLPGYGTMQLSCDTMSADGNAFPFQLQLIGTPDDKSTAPTKTPDGGIRTQIPTKTWAEGWIRVRKP